MSQLKVDSIIPRGGLPSGAHGGIIQTVYVMDDTAFSTTTTGGVDTSLSATINMQSSSNKLLIVCSPIWSTISNEAYMALTDGSNNVLEQAAARDQRGRYHWGTHYNGAGSNAQYHSSRESLTILHSPAATGNFTVKLRIYNINSGQTVTINRNLHDTDRVYDPASISTLTLMEVSA
tara:strand:+ start:1336 stop:1866 length:531 start_codon:yes stop_codon:yes gene_type:complete